MYYYMAGRAATGSEQKRPGFCAASKHGSMMGKEICEIILSVFVPSGLV